MGIVSASLVLEVVSDVVCPWCFIGKRRLEKALGMLGRTGVEIRWLPFQLNPGAPREGMARAAYRARKFGSLAYARQLEARVAEAGAEEGIAFRFDRIEIVPNTLNAHRLIWRARREGVQDAVVERLFRAYFIDAEDVGNAEVLRRVGKESGLDPSTVESLFMSDLGRSEVLAEESESRTRGVDSVPTFFVNHQAVAAGAQPPAVLASVLSTALGQCTLEGGTCV
jgi:predicted DsbA family dithiol-disulfide isomerase